MHKTSFSKENKEPPLNQKLAAIFKQSSKRLNYRKSPSINKRTPKQTEITNNKQ